MMTQRKRATVMTIAGLVLALVLVLVLALVLLAGRSAAASPIEARAAFDLLKGLGGEWSGTAGSADGPATTVIYRVTAGATRCSRPCSRGPSTRWSPRIT
jgi:hypothetical protein